MITCQHARQLFDRYLDGELSASLQTEMHAHQLSCSACQSELAMLEACGDVVMLDTRREPMLSDSFTDRVLLARRAQTARRPRDWSRAALLVGSPMAAAASILLAVTVIMPSANHAKKTVTASEVVAVSPKVREAMIGLTGGQERSQQAQIELEQTPSMATVGFMDEVLDSLVDQVGWQMDGTRASLDDLGLLFQRAAAEANERLAVEAVSAQPNEASPETDTVDEWMTAPERWNPFDIESQSTEQAAQESQLGAPL